MEGTVDHELQQHPETRQGIMGNKQKQMKTKPRTTKKDKIMTNRHEKIGKAKAEGVARKKMTKNEKENNWNEEKESAGGKEAAGNTLGSLIWRSVSWGFEKASGRSDEFFGDAAPSAVCSSLKQCDIGCA
jgi:hypothetical protein